MHDDLAQAYEKRRPLAEHVCHHLEQEVRELLGGSTVEHRTSFSVLDLEHFLDRVDHLNTETPLVEIEDQVSGRILVRDANSIRKIEREIQNCFSVTTPVGKARSRKSEY